MAEGAPGPDALLDTVLGALLRRWRPGRVLLVGTDPGGAVAAWAAAAQPAPELVRRTPAEALADPAPGDGGRWDLAVLGPDVVELLARPHAERLVAALRDLHARRLVLVPPAPLPAGWDAPACIALGLTPEAGGRLWRFDLYDYKETPDWLNPRYWAHPELWDKFRW